MASNKVYCVYFYAGTGRKVRSCAENPMNRGMAEDAYSTITNNGWRCWIEKNGVVVAKNWEGE